MQNRHSHITFDIGSDAIETALLQVLTLSDMERVVQRTLDSVDIIAQPVTLTVLVTDDDGIQALNKQYRQQDKPTDVLSFPLLDEPLVNAPADQLWLPPEANAGEQPATGEKKPVFVTPSELPTNLGDIVISWPTVLRQAREVGNSPAYELLYLLSHGVLHLIGYDDQTEAGYQAMVQLQRSVLEAEGLLAQKQ